MPTSPVLSVSTVLDRVPLRTFPVSLTTGAVLLMAHVLRRLLVLRDLQYRHGQLLQKPVRGRSAAGRAPGSAVPAAAGLLLSGRLCLLRPHGAQCRGEHGTSRQPHQAQRLGPETPVFLHGLDTVSRQAFAITVTVAIESAIAGVLQQLYRLQLLVEAPGAVSDSGSRMGAAGRRQVRSEAVAVPRPMPVTCRNVRQQRLCRAAHLVRIEGVRGSNPLSSTQATGRFRTWDRPFDLPAAANGSNHHADSCSLSFRSASTVASDGASV